MTTMPCGLGNVLTKVIHGQCTFGNMLKYKNLRATDARNTIMHTLEQTGTLML